MGTLTRTQMNSEVGAITGYSGSGDTTYINTRLGWAYEEIGQMYDWEVLHTENTSLALTVGVKTYTIPSTIRKILTVRWVDIDEESSDFLEALDSTDFFNKYPYNDAVIECSDTTGATAGFIEGETVTQATSLATGIVISESGTAPLVLKIAYRTGTFVVSQAITGATSITPTMTPDSITIDGGFPQSWTRIGGSLILSPIPGDDEAGVKLYLDGYSYVTAFSGDSSTSSLDSRLDQAIIYLATSKVFEMKREETTGANAVYWRTKALEIINQVWGNER